MQFYILCVFILAAEVAALHQVLLLTLEIGLHAANASQQLPRTFPEVCLFLQSRQ